MQLAIVLSEITHSLLKHPFVCLSLGVCFIEQGTSVYFLFIQCTFKSTFSSFQEVLLCFCNKWCVHTIVDGINYIYKSTNALNFRLWPLCVIYIYINKINILFFNAFRILLTNAFFQKVFVGDIRI